MRSELYGIIWLYVIGTNYLVKILVNAADIDITYD